MARNKALTALRNEAIRKRHADVRKKNPEWRPDAIIQKISVEFYLEPVTITKILYQMDAEVPTASTIHRRLHKDLAMAV